MIITQVLYLEFKTNKPNLKFATDITYIPTPKCLASGDHPKPSPSLGNILSIVFYTKIRYQPILIINYFSIFIKLYKSLTFF